MPRELLEFLNAYLNVPTIAYFVSQNGVIFIDPYAERCRERMLRRCTGGDAHRGRLLMYPITQCLVYYCVGRLFGWPIICVPYRADGTIDSERFEQIAEDLAKNFATTKNNPERHLRLNVNSFARPANNKPTDDRVAKMYGIFK